MAVGEDDGMDTPLDDSRGPHSLDADGLDTAVLETPVVTEHAFRVSEQEIVEQWQFHVARVRRKEFPCALDLVGLDEAVAEAVLRAALTWDPSSGAAFSSWAHTQVRYQVQEELRQQDHLTRTRRQALNKGRVLKSEEERPISLESDAGRESGDGGCDLLRVVDTIADPGSGPEDAAVEEWTFDWLYREVMVLPDRFRDLLIRRFWGRQTLREIARALRLSESRISQMEVEALRMVRSME